MTPPQRLTRSLRHILPVLLLAVAGCAWNPWTRRPPGPREPGPFERKPDATTVGRVPSEPPRAEPPRAWRKAVRAKEKPTRLVAADDTSCAVSKERFERVQIGDVIWCIWEKPGG